MNILDNFESYLYGQQAKHKTNFRLLLENPRPIPEHTDFIEALEGELAKVAYYQELIEALEII